MAEDAAVRKSGKKKKKSSSTVQKEGIDDPKENLIQADTIKKNTKATFDLYLEQAQANLERKKKSPKKSQSKSRRKKESEDVMLENLKNSGEFQKDKDEELQRKNTFNPDESKGKSNRKRDKSKKEIKTGGVDNEAFETDHPMTMDELGSASEKKAKKRKDKNAASNKDEAETQFIEDQENIKPPEATNKRKKTKKKSGQPTEAMSSEAGEGFQDDGKIVEVIVHRTDKLRANFLLQHPLVRIHVIDADTGKHLTKYNRERAVTSFYETLNRDEIPELILPVMTQAYDFKKMRSVIPWWDENIIFNECFNYLVQEKPNVMIFFEVLDFVSMNRASRNQHYNNTVKGEEGWHKEAWAFLKLRGANNHLNTNKQLRLQLYEVPRSKTVTDEVPVFQYWKYCVRRPYPSTLYISVNSVQAPDAVVPAPRSKFPTQEEKGSKTLRQIQEALSSIKDKSKDLPEPSQWSRLPGQMCKLPNKPMLNLPGGKMGCLVIKFSNNGRYLACGCHDKTSYPIKLYSIPDGVLLATLNGHYNNVYELEWSRSDKHLLSASSDGTARVWDVDEQKCTKMLSHPTFVYCSKFHPRVNKVIATGGYDNVIRVWQMDGDQIHANLYQELEGHQAYINSMVFDEEGTKLYSADGAGIIKVWNVYVTEQASKAGVTKDWKLSSTIDIEELRDQHISYIMLHPNGRRLLVQTKDNTIRLLDLRMVSITQSYVGALNFRQLILSDITPCGSFVYSGSEDGRAYVWNTETGDQVADYPELNFSQAVNDVKFHPHDNIVAFCSRGDNHKILLFKYEANLAEAYSKFFHMKPKTVLPVDMGPLGDRRSLAEDLSLQYEAKKQRAMKKLDTVLEFAKGALRQNETHMVAISNIPPGTVGPTDAFDTSIGWRSTLDSKQSASIGLGPTIMSPHAFVSGETEAMRNHLTSQMEYMRASPTAGWRPSFTSLGKNRSLSLNMSLPSKANPEGNFSVVGAEDMQPIGEVIALYDYLAQRSDELSFKRDDVISILHKDSHQWWMGILKSTGAQGFFPSNYVEELTKNDAVLEDGTEDDDDDDDDGDHHPIKSKRKTTAVMDKGQLMFVSGTESDASYGDQLEGSRRQKRRSRADRQSATVKGQRSSSRERRRQRIAQQQHM